MNYFRFSVNQYYSFETSLKAVLNKQKLTVSSQSYFTHEPGNLEILCNEIFCRSILLIARSAKTFFPAVICILSPASLLFREMLPSPTLAWKRFCKEARYLAAESFELIGVVGLLDSSTSSNPKNFSVFIECSGLDRKESRMDFWRTKPCYSDQEILDSSKAKKKLLLQARNIIGIDKEEIDKWVDKAIDFDDIIERIDILKDRRICVTMSQYPRAKN